MWVHREAFTYTYAVCVESRGQPWIPFLRSHSLLLEAGLLRGPRLTATTKLPGIKPWDTKYTLPHWDFHMRTDLRVSTLYTLHTANTSYTSLSPQAPKYNLEEVLHSSTVEAD